MLQLEPFGDGWLVALSDRNEVVLLDRGLRPRRRIGISLASEGYVSPHVALSADESLAAAVPMGSPGCTVSYARRRFGAGRAS